MKDMKFAIFANGKLAGLGTVIEKLTPEKYLCRFEIAPVVHRVIGIEELQQYNLFASEQERTAFLSAIMGKKDENDTTDSDNDEDDTNGQREIEQQ